jgi:serine/threonine protein kinase
VQSVLDLGDAGIGLVMAHMTGRTLDQFIRDEGRLSPERAEAILRDVAHALDAAHTMGIVHRDVKPGNIFIEPDGRALLADFGLARSMTGETQLTMTGVAIGTPTYMAPEQIDGVELDGRGDIYSLGLVAWEMLSGTRPWAGESLYAVLYHQKHEYLPDLRELRPDVPDRLAGIIARSIEKEPAARWQSIPELLAALDDSSRIWPGPRVRPTNTDTVRFVRPAAGAVAAGAIDWAAVMDESPTSAEQVLADERADEDGRARWHQPAPRHVRGGRGRRHRSARAYPVVVA